MAVGFIASLLLYVSLLLVSSASPAADPQ